MRWNSHASMDNRIILEAIRAVDFTITMAVVVVTSAVAMATATVVMMVATATVVMAATPTVMVAITAITVAISRWRWFDRHTVRPKSMIENGIVVSVTDAVARCQWVLDLVNEETISRTSSLTPIVEAGASLLVEIVGCPIERRFSKFIV